MQADRAERPLRIAKRAPLAGLVALAALSALAMVLALPADASHFRGGTLAAQPVPGEPTNVTFEGRGAFRCTYYQMQCPVGSLIDANLTLNVTGGLAYLPDQRLSVRVTSTNATMDWFEGTLTNATGAPIKLALPSLQPPGGGAWTFTWDGYARLDAEHWGDHHENNGGLGWRLAGTIDLRGATATKTPDRPPTTSMDLLTTCLRGQPCRVPIPTADPDGDAVQVRLATPCEATPLDGGCATLVDAQAIHAPEASRIEAGAFVWDTAGAVVHALPGATYYSAQVVLDDGHVRVPASFLIHLQDPAATADKTPQWSSDSPCGQTFRLGWEGLDVRAAAFSPEWSDVLVSVAVPADPKELPADVHFYETAPGDGHLVWHTDGKPSARYVLGLQAVDRAGRHAKPCLVEAILVAPGEVAQVVLPTLTTATARPAPATSTQAAGDGGPGAGPGDGAPAASPQTGTTGSARPAAPARTSEVPAVGASGLGAALLALACAARRGLAR